MDTTLGKRLVRTYLGFAVLMGAGYAVMHMNKPSGPGSNSHNDACFIGWLIFAIFWGPILDAWQAGCKTDRCKLAAWLTTLAIIAALLVFCIFIL
jgi:hypothetical protein